MWQQSKRQSEGSGNAAPGTLSSLLKQQTPAALAAKRARLANQSGANHEAAPTPLVRQPMIQWPGRSFEGSDDDFEDLASEFQVVFGSSFSAAFTARWNRLNAWSRIFDFGSGPATGNIFVAVQKKGHLLFNVWSNNKEYCLRVPNLISVGETHRFLCTVTNRGQMRIFQDGQLVGEKVDGGPPHAGKHQFLLVGKSNWAANGDLPFDGEIWDFCVWKDAVTWEDAAATASSEHAPRGMPAHVQSSPSQRTTAASASSSFNIKLQAALSSNVTPVGVNRASASKVSQRQGEAELLALETAAKEGNWQEYGKAILRCANFHVRLDPRFFVKLLVLLVAKIPVRVELVRLTLNMAIPEDGKAVPVKPPASSRKEKQQQWESEQRAWSYGNSEQWEDEEETSWDAPWSEDWSSDDWSSDDWSPAAGLMGAFMQMMLKGKGSSKGSSSAKGSSKGSFSAKGNSSGSMDWGLPKPESLRGRVDFSSAEQCNYFSHFVTLLHLETLHEFQEIASRMNQPPNVLMQQGRMLQGFTVQGHTLEQQGSSKKKKPSLIPGKGGTSRKSRVVFKAPANLSRLRLQSGDSVLVSGTHPMKDLLGEALVVKLPAADVGWDNELVVIFDCEISDASLQRFRSWRFDPGPNRFVYERQLAALLQLANSGKRNKICDLLLMTGVGGSNVDAWAAQMLEKIRGADEVAGAEEGMGEPEDELNVQDDEPLAASPLLRFEGRDFEGAEDDHEDLSAEYGDLIFGPNFSVKFTACWKSFKNWSRIIDFGNEQGDCNVFIGNQKNWGCLAFHFWNGDTEHKLHCPHSIQLGETNTWLCTLDERGCMRVYKDGTLIGEKMAEGTMPEVNREVMRIGKSNLQWDEPFHGNITDLQAWNVVVDCDGVEVQNSLPPPLLEFRGRTFTGVKTDFEDLGNSYQSELFTSSLSIAFTACWYSLNCWSRIIDFGDARDDSKLFIANRSNSGDLAVHIFSGKNERTLHIKDVIKVKETHRYLCTVTPRGHVRVFQDGKLIGDDSFGDEPDAGSRRCAHVYLAKSSYPRDDPFNGMISDVKVWNVVVDPKEQQEHNEAEITDPVERLRAVSAETPARSADSTKFLQQLRTHIQEEAAADLNPSQQQAIIRTLGRRLSLVQGPPGTGKTHVSARLLQLWATKMQVRPLLATSDSNIAVDNLAQAAHARGLKVVRLGRPEKVTPQIAPVLMQNILRQREEDALAAQMQLLAQEQAEGDEDNEEIAEDDIVQRNKLDPKDDFQLKQRVLKEADVICCTTVAAGSNFLQSLQFGAILIDEAAQATELSSLVPVVLRGTQQLVLVGDHCQLPPSTSCFEAEVRGLSLSLFGRLAAQGLETFFLNTQFRMHPMIAAFSAEEFYHGRLHTGITEDERPPPLGFDWPTPDAGIAFVHVEGNESSDGQSKSNTVEMHKVADILVEVLAAGELSCAEIGVVSPYSSQVRALRQNLRGPLVARLKSYGINGLAFNELEIASVDAFQGREKELIIFSAVRSNKSGNIGFLADWRRLNVMITRARRGLIIIGNTETLKADKTWNRWIEWSWEKGCFCTPA